MSPRTNLPDGDSAAACAKWCRNDVAQVSSLTGYTQSGMSYGLGNTYCTRYYNTDSGNLDGFSRDLPANDSMNGATVVRQETGPPENINPSGNDTQCYPLRSVSVS